MPYTSKKCPVCSTQMHLIHDGRYWQCPGCGFQGPAHDSMDQ